MNKTQELEVEIEDLKDKLRDYLDDERPENEIYELSAHIDNLISDYSGITKK